MIGVFDHLFGKKTEGPSVSFSFEETQTHFLGTIRRPTVTVKVWSDVFNEWHKVSMLIDTGADYTLLPQYMGYLFTTKRSGSNQHTTVGVGGDHKVHFLENVKFKVGEFERHIPVGISSSNKIPPLLGRHLFFETFKVEFDKTSRITFRE